MAQAVQLPWVWVHDTTCSGGKRPQTGPALPVYLNTTAKVDDFASLRLTGRMATIGGKRVLIATKAAEYVDKEGDSVPPPIYQMALDWQNFRELPIVESATSTIPAPPELDEEETPQRLLVEDEESVAYAKQQDDQDEVTLTGVLVVACFDADGELEGTNVHPGFFYVQDINPDEDSDLQIPCGIKVVPPTLGDVEELEPGDIVNISGTLNASSATNAEAYISASSVTLTEDDDDVPSFVCMLARSVAGGAFGAQCATYLDSLGTSPVAATGLNPVGTLVRVAGRILRIEMTHENDGISGVEKHVVYWIDDGSGMKRTALEYDEQSTPSEVVRPGLRVVAWADSTVPVRHLGDFINLAGVAGAEFSDDDTPRPVPVVRCGRMQERTIIYVDGASGSDGYNGLTWQSAKATVQAGIDLAEPGEEVWVKSLGAVSYTPGLGDDNVARITNGSSIYGGFEGDEDYRFERPASAKTALGPVQDYSVVRVGEGEPTLTTRVDGFYVAGGGGDTVPGGVAGGGICVWQPECVISYNEIRDSGANCEYGGGIACVASSSFVTGNTVKQNGRSVPHPTCGGGIGLMHCSAPDCFTYLSRNTIEENVASGWGGGIGAYDSRLLIRHSHVSDNCSVDGGGIGLENSACILTRSSVEDNGFYLQTLSTGTARHGGGLCYSAVDNYPWELSLSVTDTVFDGNCSSETGGAIHADNVNVRDVSHNKFTENVCSSEEYGGMGGPSTPVLFRRSPATSSHPTWRATKAAQLPSTTSWTAATSAQTARRSSTTFSPRTPPTASVEGRSMPSVSTSATAPAMAPTSP